MNGSLWSCTIVYTRKVEIDFGSCHLNYLRIKLNWKWIYIILPYCTTKCQTSIGSLGMVDKDCNLNYVWIKNKWTTLILLKFLSYRKCLIATEFVICIKLYRVSILARTVKGSTFAVLQAGSAKHFILEH